MGAFEDVLAKQRLARARASELRPAPLGRLGTKLWVDIERYLSFVEIARGEPGGDAAASPAPTTRRLVFVRSMFEL